MKFLQSEITRGSLVFVVIYCVPCRVPEFSMFKKIACMHECSVEKFPADSTAAGTQCKISWNSCQDLAYSYIFPFTLETLDKILFILASHKPLEFLDKNLGKSLIKSVKRMNETSILFPSILLLFALPATLSIIL